jgi:hypothetical protein
MATTEVVKPSYLNPYKPGSPMKSQGSQINQYTSQDHTWFNITRHMLRHISQIVHK